MRQEGGVSLASGADSGCCGKRAWGSRVVPYAAGAVQDTASTMAKAIADTCGGMQSLGPDLYSKMLKHSQVADGSIAVQGTKGLDSDS